MKHPDNPEFDQHVSSYKEDFTPDVSAGLERLRTRVGSPAGTANVRRLPRYRYAAVATLLLLLTVGYLAYAGDGNTVIINNTATPMTTTLPDGTRVLLQQGAELTYGESFNATDRLIEFTGQAFFEVHNDAARPFLVQTSETELRVTGTAFNLRMANDELEVEVSEGAVQLTRNAQIIKVGANYCGLALPGRECTLMKADHLNRHAWRTGTLRFQGNSIETVIKTIANNYGYSIKFDGECSFPVSGTFSTEDPVSVLRTLAELGGGRLETDASQKSAFALTDVCDND